MKLKLIWISCGLFINYADRYGNGTKQTEGWENEKMNLKLGDLSILIGNVWC